MCGQHMLRLRYSYIHSLLKKGPPLSLYLQQHLIRLIPYFTLLEIGFWLLMILTIPDDVRLIVAWLGFFPLDLSFMGHLGMYIAFLSLGVSCLVFMSYNVNNCYFNSVDSSSVLVPSLYIQFSYLIISAILPMVVVTKFATLFGLFARRKWAWNLMLLSTILLILVFVVSLNVVGFTLYTLTTLYGLFQIRHYYVE